MDAPKDYLYRACLVGSTAVQTPTFPRMEMSNGLGALLAFVGLAVAGPVIAEVRAACELPDSGVFERTGGLCADEMPGSAPQCRKLLDALANTDEPTVVERLALAYGRTWAANHGGNQAARDAERLGRDELTALAAERPSDPMVLYALLAFAEDQEDWVGLLRRVVELDPGCEKAWHYLIRALPSTSESERNERLGHMLDAYRHARSWKLNFAALVYADLERNDVDEAHAFRATVIRDMELGNLELDAAGRASSLALVCDHDPFAIRLELLCLDAIREVVAHDIAAGVPPGADVLRAAGKMAEVASTTGLVWLEGVSPDFGEEGAEHVIALREILDSVPEERRTAGFHVAYADMVGPQRQVTELRRAWAFDRSEGHIGLKLAGALVRSDRIKEAAAAYRTVIENDDGRACLHGDSTTCAHLAARRLRDLDLRSPSND